MKFKQTKNVISSILLLLVFSGCANNYKLYQENIMDQRINSDLSKSNYFNDKTTKSEIIKELGKPVKIEKINNSEVLHFCKTGSGYDDFVAIELNNNIFRSKKDYRIMAVDVGGVTGHCSKFARSINEVALLEQQRVQIEQQRVQNKKDFLNRLAEYEKVYLNEFEKIIENTQKENVKWVQPNNKIESCKVYVGYGQEDPTQDESFKLYWDGQCKNGYAHGLGREFSIADLTNIWQIAIYRKGKPENFAVMNDVLHDFTLEGELKYGHSNHHVLRYVDNKNNDISIVYSVGRFGGNEPDTVIQTSPFWNNSFRYLKAYPNFRYEHIDSRNNDEEKLDFSFTIFDKNNNKNGWAIEKLKNQNILYGEYVNNNAYKIDLPQEYINKANSIINEIQDSYNKALNAQSQAELIKKQYLRKICKSSVKVSFMDNEEYKEVCNSQYEKDLFSKVNAKLESISKEKISRLEQQRFNQQQEQQEQFRQQQLALEKEKIEYQRRQAKAAENANAQRSWDSLNQSIQNINSNIIKQNTNLQLQQMNNYIQYGY